MSVLCAILKLNLEQKRKMNELTSKQEDFILEQTREKEIEEEEE